MSSDCVVVSLNVLLVVRLLSENALLSLSLFLPFVFDVISTSAKGAFHGGWKKRKRRMEEEDKKEEKEEEEDEE